eukprot:g1987.t1
METFSSAPSPDGYRGTPHRKSLTNLMTSSNSHSSLLGDFSQFDVPRAKATKGRGGGRPYDPVLILQESQRERDLNSSTADLFGELLGNNEATSSRIKLDWKAGVFVPCLLCIWGPMMFLRLGWIVGQAGVVSGTLVITLANVVTLITTLSMSAIATNGVVSGGGAYFLISRALGPSVGGVIGLLFYLAQAVATAMYAVGFAETFVNIYTDGSNKEEDFILGDSVSDTQLIALITMVVLLGVAKVGVGWYAKAQVGLLIILVLAMSAVFFGSFFAGSATEPHVSGELTKLQKNAEDGFAGYSFQYQDGEEGRTQWLDREGLLDKNENSPWDSQWSVDVVTGVEHNFATVFAVFFPAVTGIMAGANMSGDLENPSSDIPKGTLAAIGTTYATYVILAWVLAFSCTRCVDGIIGEVTNLCPTQADEEWLAVADSNGTIPVGGLLYNKLIMKDLSLWGPLVYLGACAATLSSALASLVGAPRILQSLAADEVFPWACLNFFGKGDGPQQEPTRGYYLTFAIAAAISCIGQLDVIASATTTVILAIYAGVNYACFAASDVGSPSWRPSFQFYDKRLAAIGALLCITLMFALQTLYAVVTLTVAGLLFRYLEVRRHIAEKRRSHAKTWGVAGEAQRYTAALRANLALQMVPDHTKTYRPQFLVMAGSPGARPWLIKFVSMLHKGGGLFLIGQVSSMSEEVHHYATRRKSKKKVVGPTVNLNFDSSDEEKGFCNNDEWKSRDTSVAVDDLLFDDSFSTPSSRKKMSLQSRAHQASTGLHAMNLANKLRKAHYAYFYDNPDVWQGGSIRGGVFCDVVTKHSGFCDGFSQLMQLSGLGKLRPNTVILGFKKRKLKGEKENDANVKAGLEPSDDDYVQIIHDSICCGYGVAVVRDDDRTLDVDMCSSTTVPTWSSWLLGDRSMISAAQRVKRGEAFIDVWWLSDDGGLTMLLPYLLSQSFQWQDHQLRVWVLEEKPQNKQNLSTKSSFTNFQESSGDASAGLAESDKVQQQLEPEFKDIVDIDIGVTMKSDEDTSSDEKEGGKENESENDQYPADNKTRMEDLLRSLRINAVVHSVPFDSCEPLSPERIEMYRKLNILDTIFEDGNTAMGDGAEKHQNDVRDANNTRALRLLQIAEKLREFSSDSTIIFMTLPLPLPTMSNCQYLALLDIMSGVRGSAGGWIQPPTVFVRGAEQCLTSES